MSFLHLWPIYLGVAAAALPVAVHYLTRPRPVRLPLSTLRFVREAISGRRARNRLRDFLVLALRTLAVLLLALAVARPLVSDRLAAIADPAGHVARVVVLDVSQSMAASQRGIELFERARSRAGEHLSYRSGLQANLVKAGATPSVSFDELSTNLAALREEVSRAAVLPERLNVQATLAAAAQLLATADESVERRELVIISDFQRTNWAAADFSILPAETRIELESVAPQTALANLAVLRVGATGRPTVGESAHIEVEIGNFTPAARRVNCEITLGPSAFQLSGVCPPGGKLTLSQEAPVHSAGWLGGDARLVDADDALRADDRRPFVVEVHPPPVYDLMTRQNPDDPTASSFYVERALAPYRTGAEQSGARIARVDPANVDTQALAACDLILLDHPGKLPLATNQLLAGLLRRGRAIFYLAAEPLDATNIKQISDLAGRGLQLPVEFLPPESGSLRRELFLMEVRRDQSPFHILGDNVSGAVASLRFGGGLASRRLEGALADDVVAQYNDRSAALVVCSSDAGVMAIWNADLASSNFPASPLFVPLLNELVDRLIGQRQKSTAVTSGETMAMNLPAEVTGVANLKITGPGGAAEQAMGELADEGLGIVWRSRAAMPPGVYRVARGDQTVMLVASELPAEESDLRPISLDVLQKRLAGGRDVHYRHVERAADERDEFWTWLAAAAVLAMASEVLVLRASRT